LLAYYRGFDANVNTLQSALGTPSTGDEILTRYTSGEGVQMFVDVQTAFGATPSTMTVNYTDQDDAAGVSQTFTVLASAAQGKLGYAYSSNGLWVPLAAGDRGVRSVQSCQLSAATGSGTFAICLCKPLCTIPVVQNGATTMHFGMWEGLSSLDAQLLEGDPALSFIWLPASTNVGPLSGSLRSLLVRQL
jgi:hypothetical protein